MTLLMLKKQPPTQATKTLSGDKIPEIPIPFLNSRGAAMFRFTPRSWFVGAAAVLVSVSVGNVSQAQHVRHDAHSVEGKKMLAIYAKAVAKMKATKPGDPDSWTFQWYSHSVKGSTTKAAELLAIYGPNPSPNKMLAQSMWDTCQAHHAPGIEDDFLPWHRMFVYYFEEIIRDVSGEKSFTLPYWNYSTSNKTFHGVIPPEFTKKNDPLYKSLYVENRNPGVNMGQPIDKGHPPNTLSTDSLSECFYEPSGGVHPGFCQRLDFGLHGTVHVLVGNAQNMGSVPYAGGDPIFWLHHCNVDRLWASWNAGERKNPSGSGSFTFAEKKKKVMASVHEWMDPKTEKHGYCYDHLEPVPKCPTIKAIFLARLENQVRVAMVKHKEIKLGSGPTRVTLEPLAVKEGGKPLAFHERIRALPKDKHVYLIVKNLQADAQPGVLYHLYLDLPEGAKDEKLTPHLVGTVNFFNAVMLGGHGKKGPEPFFQFDITDLARSLLSRDLLTATPTLTIAPAGTPAEKANPVIGEVTVVEN
jgi:tyrosinase